LRDLRFALLSERVATGRFADFLRLQRRSLTVRFPPFGSNDVLSSWRSPRSVWLGIGAAPKGRALILTR